MTSYMQTIVIDGSKPARTDGQAETDRQSDSDQFSGGVHNSTRWIYE